MLVVSDGRHSELRGSAADIRKGMPPRKLSHDAFVERFLAQYRDAAFDNLYRELIEVAEAAWDAYADSRKAPVTRKAGAGFADPDYEIAVDWLEARAAIQRAQERFEDREGPVRLLLINGSSRTEHTCPGENVEDLAAGRDGA
ncbi:MAG: hypothetical protein QOF03_1448 [Alphaproteobacteria bacterium]|jgi:hypothetical protein|nr:hypothetical protein [Alphaproteobacteria bacterium]